MEFYLCSGIIRRACVLYSNHLHNPGMLHNSDQLYSNRTYSLTIYTGTSLITHGYQSLMLYIVICYFHLHRVNLEIHTENVLFYI